MNSTSRFSLLLCTLALATTTAWGKDGAPIDFGPPVHTVTVPADEPYLPEGPGRNQFMGFCTMCHSPRFITHQPPFTRATWAAEVAKMRGEYGAPIPEAAVEPIIDYLMFFNGKETP